MTDPTGDPIRRLPSLVLVLIVPVVAFLAIGLTQLLAPEENGSSVASGANAISIKNFAFHPPTLTATPGARIVVVNRDQTAHTVTAADKSFDTGDVIGGAKAAIGAPMDPGTYNYICDIHQYMQGTLRVRG